MKLKPLSDADLKALLARPVVAKFATHAPNGEIRITPVWFKEAGGAILANTLEQTDLAQNLRRDPRCSLLIDTEQMPDVVAAHYWGSASTEPTSDVDRVARIIERYVGSMDNARGMAQRNLSMGPVVIIRFQAERTVTWDLRPA
jgi:hypothetical protein